MKSPYISELEPNQISTGTFLVAHKDVRQKRTGEIYLSLTLADRTGDLDAKMWDHAAEVVDTFERDSFVRVKGLLQIFQNRPQLTVHKIQPVPDSEIDTADFFPVSKRDRDEMFRELQGWIASIANPHLKSLLEAIFSDEAIAAPYRTAPAAKTVHHAWIGGLIEHVLSLCQLARFTAAHYPGIDLDLLLAGVMLHDIGKIRELSYARTFGYTDEGQLIGHISIGVGMVLDKLRLLPDFPPQLRDLLLHMILSHHGELEYGSPKVPLFAEALLLHHLDSLDSKMEHARHQVDRDPLVEGCWTAYSGPLDRSLLKKEQFLNPRPATPAAMAAGLPGQQPGKNSKPERRPAPESPFAAKLREAIGPRS
jgi:3'-5' exoribonuclease